jgi:large subunit ribosomal protein L6
MSRIGKMPITIPTGVVVSRNGDILSIKGPKGTLVFSIPENIIFKSNESEINIESDYVDPKSSALHGFVRATIANLVHGVTIGWTKSLELSGVGYRATMNSIDLVLNVGYSHSVTIHPPEGITITVVEGKIVVSGADKHLVGQIASKIRDVKPPEPYKGKGIKYVGEYIRKKAGKSAKAVGGAAK